MGYMQWEPYVPVAERRRKATAEMAKLAKKGHAVSPVTITGRTIATTAWGKAWCANLETYSDHANRLPRGRTYVCNGSVVDLHIASGKINARVSGSSIYRISITVTALAKSRWDHLVSDCAGGIDSLVELLQGRLSTGVMQRLSRQGDGLFPTSKEIKLSCSCPDGAYLCKHVAAVLYGVGARLDHQPELLFTLRQVAATDLLTKAGSSFADQVPASARGLATDDIGALFGLELDAPSPRKSTAAVKVPRVKKTPAPIAKTAARKPPARAAEAGGGKRGPRRDDRG